MKFRTLYVRIVWICRKFEYPELHKFNKKLCTLDVRILCICKKFAYPELRKFIGKLCTLYVRIVQICRKIKYPKLHKFNGKLCTLDVWKIVYIMCTDCQDLQKMLNIQNCVKLTGNCIHQMYEFSGFVENSTSRIA